MILTYPQGQQVDVQFDEKAHTYVVAHKLTDGEFSDYRPTHGITAPLVVVPKAFIKKWVAKEVCRAALEFVASHPDMDAEYFAEMLNDLDLYESKAKDEVTGKTLVTYYRINKKYPFLKWIKAAPDRKATDGKEFGTWLHKAIEQYYKSDRKDMPILTPEVQGMWDSFITFDNYHKPVPDNDGLEFLVYSLLYGYSGQGDYRGYMGGKYCIGDWKSTNRSDFNLEGIDTDYFYQLGGLAQAEFERTGKWPDDVFIANFDKKGEDPIVVWASDFGMSPQAAAKCYISCFNNYHMQEFWNYKFKKR